MISNHATRLLASTANQLSGLYMAKATNFIKKETLAQVLSCEFCKICKDMFFTDRIPLGDCFYKYLNLK